MMDPELPSIDDDDDLDIVLEDTLHDAAVIQDTSVVKTTLVEVLGADVPLPDLLKFVPDQRLREALKQATDYADLLPVSGAEGLERADIASTALRTGIQAVESNLEDPIRLAHRLHKSLTSLRDEWTKEAKRVLGVVGQRIYSEKTRLDAIAAEQRRKDQEEENRKERERLAKEAEAAAAQGAPEAVVQQIQEAAKTAKAAPVQTAYAVPRLAGSTTVTTWKGRLSGTLDGAETQQPKMDALNATELASVLAAMKAIVESGGNNLTIFEINWSVVNKRASADKSTFDITGFEAFSIGGTRGKGQR